MIENQHFIRWAAEVCKQEYDNDLKLFNANMKQNLTIDALEVRIEVIP